MRLPLARARAPLGPPSHIDGASVAAAHCGRYSHALVQCSAPQPTPATAVWGPQPRSGGVRSAHASPASAATAKTLACTTVLASRPDRHRDLGPGALPHFHGHCRVGLAALIRGGAISARLHLHPMTGSAAPHALRRAFFPGADPPSQDLHVLACFFSHHARTSSSRIARGGCTRVPSTARLGPEPHQVRRTRNAHSKHVRCWSLEEGAWNFQLPHLAVPNAERVVQEVTSFGTCFVFLVSVVPACVATYIRCAASPFR